MESFFSFSFAHVTNWDFLDILRGGQTLPEIHLILSLEISSAWLLKKFHFQVHFGPQAGLLRGPIS